MSFSPSSHFGNILTGEMESGTWVCAVWCAAVPPVNCSDSGPSLGWFHVKGFYLPPLLLVTRKRKWEKGLSICLLLYYLINQQKLASTAKISSHTLIKHAELRLAADSKCFALLKAALLFHCPVILIFTPKADQNPPWWWATAQKILCLFQRGFN